MAKTKTGVTIDPRILQDMDIEAKRLNMSRSEFIEALMACYVYNRSTGKFNQNSFDWEIYHNHKMYSVGLMRYSSIPFRSDPEEMPE